MNNIVFSGTAKNGQPYKIRYIQGDDVQQLCRYINTISQEKTFITMQGETISLEEEQAYVAKQLQGIVEQTTVQLVVECEGKIIACSSIDLGVRIEKHVGTFGISVLKDYRGIGIGKQLMSSVLAEAQTQLIGLRIIKLGVFGNNPLAKQMYESFGFQEYGRLPGGVLHRGTYVDHIYMYKNVSSLE